MQKTRTEDVKICGTAAERIAAGPPPDAVWAGPLAADPHVAADLLIVHLCAREVAESMASASADEWILRGLQQLRASYPGRRICMAGWFPPPRRWPRSVDYLVECKAGLLLPPELELYWVDKVWGSWSSDLGEWTGGR